MIDVAADQHFVATLLSDLRRAIVLQDTDYRVHFKPTGRLQTIDDKPIQNVRAVSAEQTNSTALVDDRYVLKFYRKLENGLNPEIEVGRFLTDIAGFSNTPALLGSVEVKGPNTESAVAIVHAFVENQGDAWTLTSAALDRFIEGENLVGTADSAPALDEKSAYQRYMTQTGKRVAEMQMALASRDDIADFRPVAATVDDTAKWIDNLITRSNRAFARLENTKVGAADAPLVGRLLLVARDLAKKLGIAADGYRLIINCNQHGGQEVYHLHLHLIGGAPLGPMTGAR